MNDFGTLLRKKSDYAKSEYHGIPLCGDREEVKYPLQIEVYCDGLCEPNPGGVATYGFVAYEGRAKLHEGCGLVGTGPDMTNNVAEYEALCRALTYLKEKNLADKEIVVKSDSRLLVNRMNGEWKKRPKGLYADKYYAAKELQKSFRSLKFEWIMRELNTEADALCWRAYKEYVSNAQRR